MHTVSISDFRANLLKYLEIANSGEQVMVSSNGKLLATISPPVDQKATVRKKLKSLSNTAKVHDVIKPIDNEWDALS